MVLILVLVPSRGPVDLGEIIISQESPAMEGLDCVLGPVH